MSRDTGEFPKRLGSAAFSAASAAFSAASKLKRLGSAASAALGLCGITELVVELGRRGRVLELE